MLKVQEIANQSWTGGKLSPTPCCQLPGSAGLQSGISAFTGMIDPQRLPAALRYSLHGERVFLPNAYLWLGWLMLINNAYEPS